MISSLKKIRASEEANLYLRPLSPTGRSVKIGRFTHKTFALEYIWKPIKIPLLFIFQSEALCDQVKGKSGGPMYANKYQHCKRVCITELVQDLISLFQ